MDNVAAFIVLIRELWRKLSAALILDYNAKLVVVMPRGA